MTDGSDDRLKQLEAYVLSLPEKERRDLGATAHQSERGIFNLVKSGDAAGLHAALKRDPSLVERQDENDMTPMHWAGIDKSGLMLEVLTQNVNAAPWMRDKAGRLPLDVMRDAGQHEIADRLERITYPRLFHDKQRGTVDAKKVAAFGRKYDALGKPDTWPIFAARPEKGEKTPSQPRLRSRENEDRER